MSNITIRVRDTDEVTQTLIEELLVDLGLRYAVTVS